MTAYYNEIDPFAAAWLRELIKAGHIASGEVDERSIEDVVPNDLAGFVQCHFFAGIGVWSYALRRAGWPDDKPVWTGSCPCQPFSTAGKGAGFADERHLWPALYHLIGQRRPYHVFGEQVASKDGLAWLNLVQTDMENAAYTIGMVDTCAAGFGAPHIRQRLYWLAHAEMRGHIGGNLGDETEAEPKAFGRWKDEGRRGNDFTHGSEYVRLADPVPTGRPARGAEPGHGQAAGGFGAVGLADSPANGLDKGRQCVAATGGNGIAGDRTVGGLEHSEGNGRNSRRPESGRGSFTPGRGEMPEHRPGPTNGQWGDVDWLFCRDGKWRPTQSISEQMADGLAHRLGYSRFKDLFSLNPLKDSEKEDMRIGRLRGYGNAICAVQAEEFIRAYMEIKENTYDQ